MIVRFQGEKSSGSRIFTPIFLTLITLILSGCSNLLNLKSELAEAKQLITTISGNVNSKSCKNCATVLVVLRDKEGLEVDTYQVFDKPSEFTINTLPKSRYIFAFHDQNNDFEYQKSEPYGWFDLDQIKASSGSKKIEITISKDQKTPPPSQLPNLFSIHNKAGNPFPFNLGKVISLDAEIFSQSNAEDIGMYQPLTFLRTGLSGIFFLEEYTPEKIPVLFVHGIGGTPRNFEAIINSLDRTKFQPWVLYYPSGLSLRVSGSQMYGWLNSLKKKYKFKELQIVAHSMGGLVSRFYLDRCSRNQDCTYLRSFTSLSSPFNGHDAAKLGVMASPVVMPVWKSMAPGSDFLTNLFNRPLPNGLPHYLAFGYYSASLCSSSSGDGVVTVESQLRTEAQLGAKEVRGFNDDHMSILANPEVQKYINAKLIKNSKYEKKSSAIP
jgi:pimeloyl-ACP methyl ester carboxylesterase